MKIDWTEYTEEQEQEQEQEYFYDSIEHEGITHYQFLWTHPDLDNVICECIKKEDKHNTITYTIGSLIDIEEHIEEGFINTFKFDDLLCDVMNDVYGEEIGFDFMESGDFLRGYE